MIDDVGISLSSGLFFLSIMVLLVAYINLYIRWKDKPRTESFWWLVGVTCHWSATLNNQSLAIFNEFNPVHPASYFVVSNLGKCVALMAGFFYARALTMGYRPKAWRYIAASAIVVCMTMYAVLSFR